MIDIFIPFIVTFLMVLTFTFWISAHYRNKERDRIARENTEKKNNSKEKAVPDTWEDLIDDMADYEQQNFNKPLTEGELHRFVNFLLTNGIITHIEYVDILNRAYPYTKG